MINFWLITVNYKDTELTKYFIESLEKFSKFKNLKVFIVDNHSSKDSRKKLEKIKLKSMLQIKIFSNEKNMYYWPAANKLILDNFKKYKTHPDWIIVCNNDISFIDDNFFNKLSKYNNKVFHIIGPKILNNKNADLNPFMEREMSRTKRWYWRIYFKNYYFSQILIFLNNLRKKFKYKTNQRKIRKVYAVHGSIIIFSKEFFRKGGMLDTNFELYGEEITTAEISKKYKCETYYIPHLKVFHNEHSSTKKINKKKIFFLAKKTHEYFIRSYLKK